MGYIKTSIELDVNKLKREFDGRLDEAQKVLDGLILRDSTQYVPVKHGDLRESGDTGGEGGKLGGVEWEEDYALYQYYGKHYKHKTPTRSRWFEYAKYMHLGEWLKEIQL